MRVGGFWVGAFPGVVSITVHQGNGHSGGVPYATVSTASRIRTLFAPAWVFSLGLRAYNAIHGFIRYRVKPLPTAGRMLEWDVECMACGCRFVVHTPHGWHRCEVQAELPRLMSEERDAAKGGA